MNRHVRRTAQAWLEEERPAVVVVVLEARGSAPRGPGTRMLVAGGGQTVGTIGGGHLELEAIREAHALLSQRHRAASGALPARPGARPVLRRRGHARLQPLDATQLAAWPDPEPLFYLQLHGAGHVGTAIARLLSTIDCLVDWVDEREDMFPFALFDGAPWPDHIRVIADDGVEDEVKAAPKGAYYLVLTHNHDLDLRISEAILKRGDFGFFGLIGSKTKRARFIHRFEQRGIAARSHRAHDLPDRHRGHRRQGAGDDRDRGRRAVAAAPAAGRGAD